MLRSLRHHNDRSCTQQELKRASAKPTCAIFFGKGSGSSSSSCDHLATTLPISRTALGKPWVLMVTMAVFPEAVMGVAAMDFLHGFATRLTAIAGWGNVGLWASSVL